MIPVLYAHGEKRFKTNGIGRLSDAIECSVTEERNGIFELEMVYPIHGRHYEDIIEGNIILAKPSWNQNPQPFDIQKVTPSTDEMTAEIYATHISYRLNGIPVRPFSANGLVMALNGIKNNALIDNDFEVWTDIDNTDTKFTLNQPKSFRACLGGTEGSILQTFSGSGSMEFMWDNKMVRVYRHRGADHGVSIRYGKNLSSLKQEASIENCYTGVLAYWKDSQSEETVSSDIQYVDKHEEYPFQRIFILDVSSDYQSENNDTPTKDQLNSKAKSYIVNNDVGTPSVNMEVSFIDLSQTDEYKNVAPLERVNLCDTVSVYFPDICKNAKAKVIKTKWDVLRDRYDSIELGDAKSSFSDTIQQQAHDAVDQSIKDTRSFMQKALDHAADLIKGGESGHMVIGTNANGESNELFFMDTDNKATAKNVLRLNMNGIAFSQSGINGPFNSAWTIDSQFVADFITTGTLRAGLIKAGILSDAKGTNFWNMETGDFRLSSGAKIGDSTIASSKDVSDGDSDTLNSANGYADNGDESTLNDAKTYAESVKNALDKSLNQESIFNRLTNNGKNKGIYMQDGELYINASYLKSGTLAADLIKAGILSDAKGTNFWNMETGDFRLSSGAKIGDSTIASSKDISNFDESLNQTSVFNRLTNNGQIKGIYMSDGSLFINADYIKSGTMSADLIRGGTYICGGKNNGNGKFTLRNAQDADLINFDNSGITVKCTYNGSDYSCLIDNNGLWVKADGYGFLRTSLFSTDQYLSTVLNITSGDGQYVSNMSAGMFEVYRVLNSSGNYTNVEDLFFAGVRGLYCKGTKSRIVDTEDYGDRLLYCYETPSPMFGDIGEGVIGDDGQAFIQIDPMFAETINTSQYQVFLQKYGKGDCYISERHSTFFIVKGDPGLSFGWEIKAKQSDFDQMRLETFYNNEPEGDNTNYGVNASEHIKELNEGRLLS